MIRKLGKNSIKAAPEQTFKEIARANGTDPHALFEIPYGLVIQE
jgi:hypothetical protein